MSSRRRSLARPLSLLSTIAVMATTIVLPSAPAAAEARCPFADSVAAAQALGAPIAGVAVTTSGITQTCVISAAQPAKRVVVTAVRYTSPDEASSRLRFAVQRGSRTGSTAPIYGLGDEAARVDLLVYVRVKEIVYTIDVLNGSTGEDLAARETALARAVAAPGVPVPAAPAIGSATQTRPTQTLPASAGTAAARTMPAAATAAPAPRVRNGAGTMAPGTLPNAAPPPAASGPVTLSAAHRIYSPVVAGAFSAVGIGAATKRATFQPPKGFDRFSALALVDGVYTSGAIECTATKTLGDRVVLEETPEYLIATMYCGRSLYRPIGTHVTESRPHNLSIAYRKAAIPRVFEAATGVPMRPEQFVPNRKLVAIASSRDASVRMATTRDERELAACIAGFNRFRTDRQTGFFRAVFYTRIFHCETDASLNRAVAVRSLATFANRMPRIRSHGVSPIVAPHLFTQENFSAPDLQKAAAPIYHDSGLVGVQTGTVPKGALIFKVGLGVVYGARTKDAPLVTFQLSVNPFEKIASKTAAQPPAAMLQHGLSSAAVWSVAAIPKPGAVLPAQQSLTEAKPLPDPCAGFGNPPNLAIQRVVPVTYAATVKGQLGTEIDAAPYTASFPIDWADFNTVFKGFREGAQSDMLMYVRAMPMTADKRCAAVPSAWMPVTVHDVYPRELAEYNQHKNDELARNAIAGNDGVKGSPITVSFVSYTPPIVPDYEQVVHLVANRQIEDKTLEDFGINSGKHAITQGCSFRPDRIIAWSHEDHSNDESKLERAWDSIIWVFGTYTGLIDMLESAVVDAATVGLSGGKCAFGDPTVPGETAGDTYACSYLRNGCRFVEDAALMGAGMPASGGTAAAVLDQGATWANASLAAEVASSDAGPMITAMASFVGDQAINLLVKKVKDKLYQQSLKAVECTDPVAAEVLAQYGPRHLFDPGPGAAFESYINGFQLKKLHPDDKLLAREIDTYNSGWVVDPAGCISAPANPFSWGGWDPARNPRSAILWLRVKKNAPSGVAEQDQYITLHDDGGMFDDRVVKVPVGQMQVGNTLDIPVVLAPNYDKYWNAPQVRASANSEFDPLGIKQDLWNTDYGNNAAINVYASSSYRWTDQPVSISNTVNVYWGSRQTGVRTAFGTEDQPSVAAECDPQL